MKKIYKKLQKLLALCVIILIVSFKLYSQTDLDYYLPENAELNPEVPTPQEITGYSVGDWHFSHDQLLQYAKKIAEISDRAILKEYARSWENRPLVYLVFTDPQNHSKLEEIRLAHIGASKYGRSIDSEEMDPLVIHLGYGVHGNESSASNSSILTLYYLAASEDEWVVELLKNSIIIVDPCLNPDGFTRHSSWINMNRSQTLVSDPAARGFNEPWPGARTNHYWFDLNRDYIPLTHPESKGRINLFHSWLPHILTDHHEMGANSTFFFQPGVETRNNPIVPEENYILTKEIAGFHARALDKFGVTYFTEERFDDYYFGKGSSYPDANGGIGILFEQAGFRGHLRETDHGLKTFSYAVRNQFNVTLSTLRAGMDLKEDLINYQREFFSSGLQKADSSPVKAYIFGEEFDHTRLQNFIELLLNHKIEVHRIEKDLQVENKFYSKENSYLVLTSQEQFLLIRSLFDPVNEFRDTTFYDVSTWT
ncbi:MAG: M14 family zinc carboxypeptidase, partial [Bacteroidales bacterium]